VPVLVDVLGDGNPFSRFAAARSLDDLGSKASAAVPALTDLLLDSDEEVRTVAAHALARIKDEKTPPLKFEWEPQPPGWIPLWRPGGMM
jgi:HEAT repeat protein